MIACHGEPARRISSLVWHQVVRCAKMAWEEPVAGLTADVILGADLLYDPGAHLRMCIDRLSLSINQWTNLASVGQVTLRTLQMHVHSSG